MREPGTLAGMPDAPPHAVRSAGYILPSVFDRDVVPAVAKAVATATRGAGLARKTRAPEP